jgi:hypothetical protein
MFKRSTLFNVGAGASNEVGFPVGVALAEKIGSMLEKRSDSEATRGARYGDNEFFAELNRAHHKEFSDYAHAAARIAQGIRLASSIDDFLDIHSEDKRINGIGKAAIIRAVLKEERNSNLMVSQSNIYNKMDYSKIADTWFVKLMRVLGPGVTISNVANIFDNVAFIVFKLRPVFGVLPRPRASERLRHFGRAGSNNSGRRPNCSSVWHGR